MDRGLNVSVLDDGGEGADEKGPIIGGIGWQFVVKEPAKIGRVQIDSIVVVNAWDSSWFSVLMSHRFAVMRADGFERGLDKL